MKSIIGVAVAAAGILAQSAAAQADKLDLVLQRLDALEQSNAKLVKENAALRERLNRVETTKGGVATDSKVSTGNAAGQVVGGRSKVNAPQVPVRAASTEIDANGHGFLEHKVGAPLTFYTPGGEITAYGNLDVSLDATSKNISTLSLNGATPPVGNFGWMPAISTNLSYLGVRGFQRISDFPFNFVYQFEVGVDVSATPGLRETNSNLSDTVNGALFNRNTFIGFSSPVLGAFKVGKTDAPYKNSTAAFNPFVGEIGDYAVVMGNTGGDNRVEFGTRLDHAIWYESPSWGGFQLNALYAPGQNRATDSSDLGAGESDCAGGNVPQSGGDLPIACNDGGFSDAISANLSYTNGPFYATAAYERHERVNRQSDITAIYGTATLTSPFSQNLFNEDVAAEDAFKVGALYHFPTNDGGRHLRDHASLCSGRPRIPE
jgi:predicted porin